MGHVGRPVVGAARAAVGRSRVRRVGMEAAGATSRDALGRAAGPPSGNGEESPPERCAPGREESRRRPPPGSPPGSAGRRVWEARRRRWGFGRRGLLPGAESRAGCRAGGLWRRERAGGGRMQAGPWKGSDSGARHPALESGEGARGQRARGRGARRAEPGRAGAPQTLGPGGVSGVPWSSCGLRRPAVVRRAGRVRDRSARGNESGA